MVRSSSDRGLVLPAINRGFGLRVKYLYTSILLFGYFSSPPLLEFVLGLRGNFEYDQDLLT
ncbi:hypothetical protein BDV40DRAFT_260434 [Aspergillus tamarii]|uniref:Uncharacterized protein n=1 Tax=Aspergillus tamarii TaxID=41984 RepID=A0A5N6V3L9_ASPTM|nr:hypothetical protein BDV40DRAFT_260434 [Aspergillus tamarii]